MRRKKEDDLEKIYLAFAEPLFYYLWKLSGSSDMAEELVQETFFRATLSLDLYEDGQVKSWLFKVGRHAYLDEWRKRLRWKWVPFYDKFLHLDRIESPYGIPEESYDLKEQAQEVDDVLTLLPENYRSILYLREYQQFTYEELSETLELNLSQVKIQLHRARQRFKQLSERAGKNFTGGD